MRPIDFLYRGLQRNPDAIAVDDGHGRSLSYRALVRKTESLAAALQWLSPEPQSRVAICAHNTVEHLLALLATLAAGKVWVPLTPRLARPEIAAMVEMTRPAVVVADEDCLGLLPATAAPVVLARTTGGQAAKDSLARLAERFDGQAPASANPGLDQIQAIKFTGGSTGKSKGVMQSYRCWNTHIVSILHAFGFRGDDVNLIVAPLTHGSSCFVMPLLAMGGRLVLHEKPMPASILDAFETGGVTTVYAPPTLIYRLLAEPTVRDRRYPNLRHMIWSAAPMPIERVRETRRVFGSVLETCYGQAEAPQIISAMRADEFDDERNLGSVGRPGPLSRVAIMSPDGALLPTGETGEIVISGDLLMSGYLDQPELTARAITGGWLHTGDVGIIDERGYVFIKDRIKDIVITGGFNVYPGEVEAALLQHPAVYDCAVFGIPDPDWGESVQAAVQLRAGASARAEDLIAFAKERLGSVKAPKRIHFHAELPRSAVGKVLRRETRAMTIEAMAAARSAEGETR